MGDAVFAPLYELCRRNGVQFRFFHQVEELVPSVNGKSIASVTVARQVDLIDGRRRRIPSAHPGEGRARAGPRRRWSRWCRRSARSCRRRRDQPRGPRQRLGPGGREGAARRARLRRAGAGHPGGQAPADLPAAGRRRPGLAMVEKCSTSRCSPMHLWSCPDAEGLAVLTVVTGSGDGHPFESWSDMSEAIPREAWAWVSVSRERDLLLRPHARTRAARPRWATTRPSARRRRRRRRSRHWSGAGATSATSTAAR